MKFQANWLGVGVVLVAVAIVYALTHQDDIGIGGDVEKLSAKSSDTVSRAGEGEGGNRRQEVFDVSSTDPGNGAGRGPATQPSGKRERIRLLEGASLVDEGRTPTDSEGKFLTRQLYRSTFKYPLVLKEELWRERDRRLELVRRDYMVGDHILVRLPDGVDQTHLKQWAEDHGYKIRSRLRTSSIFIISTPEIGASAVTNLLGAFRESFPEAENVEGPEGQPEGRSAVAEPDYVVFPTSVPNDPQFSQQWGLNNTGQKGGVADADIDAPEAWDVTTGSQSVLVGVIDTGVDRTHPDLVANMWSNPNEIAGDGLDDDMNGFVDDSWGWDFFDNDNDPSDGGSHGTHVSGTIGASGNDGVGVTGVNWNVSIVSLRFLGPAGGTTSDAIEAVEYATDLGVDLTSNSWGGRGFSSLLQGVIEDAGAAGILFVAAAGNDAVDGDVSPYYPSSYPSENIVSVAASTVADQRASYSNWGSVSVDLAAPGDLVYSTTPGASYGTKSGTSMATPYVTGALAMMRSVAPGLSHLVLKQRLLESVDPVAAFASITLSGGRLNLHSALLSVSGAYPELTAFTLDDSVGGNGDGFVNPGETAGLGITVANRGGDPALNVVATILLDPNSELAVSAPRKTLGTLAPGATLVDPAAFEALIDPQTTTPHTENVTIRLEWGDSPRQSAKFERSVSVYEPVSFSGHVVQAASGLPIQGAEVSFTGGVSGSVFTELDGSYEVDAIGGDYSVSVTAAGYAASEQVQITIPPNRTDVDFSLGTPALQITPSSVVATVNAGDVTTRTLTLRSTGDATLNWMIGDFSQTSEHFALPAATVTNPGPDGTVLPGGFSVEIPAVEGALAELDGISVGVLTFWTYPVLFDDLALRGASVDSLTFPLSAAILDGVDVLLIDDAIAAASQSDISVLRTWVEAGGGVMFMGDDSSSMANLNAAMESSGLTEAYRSTYATQTITDVLEHPTTLGVESVYVNEAGGICSVKGDAVAVMREGDGSILAAAGNLGAGRIVVVGNEMADSTNFTSGDARLFANQIVDWLSAPALWVSVIPRSGLIAAGEEIEIELELDSAGLDAGQYFTEIPFVSNAPANPEVLVPVTLDVTGAPAIAVEPASVAFPDTFSGGFSELPLTIRNLGNDDLVVSSIATFDTQFSSVGTFPIMIAPGAEVSVLLRFAPLLPGDFSSEANIASNNVADGMIVVPLAGRAVTSPAVQLNPATLDVTLGLGQSTSRVIEITNVGGTTLEWSASAIAGTAQSMEAIETSAIFTGSGAIDKASADDPAASTPGLRLGQTAQVTQSAESERAASVSLTEVLAAFDENYASIAALIPNRFDFSDGVTGSSISDGESDLFDGGNYLRTDLSVSAVPYSDGVVVSHAATGLGGSYFTRKAPGLFLFAADLDGASYFEITGNLGGDGSGAMDAAVLSEHFGRRSYTGFVKRVFNAGDPSVNHLVIVESVPGVSHEFATSTERRLPSHYRAFG